MKQENSLPSYLTPGYRNDRRESLTPKQRVSRVAKITGVLALTTSLAAGFFWKTNRDNEKKYNAIYGDRPGTTYVVKDGDTLWHIAKNIKDQLSCESGNPEEGDKYDTRWVVRVIKENNKDKDGVVIGKLDTGERIVVPDFENIDNCKTNG